MLEYDRLAEEHFELKKQYDKAKKTTNRMEWRKNIKKAKYHKQEFEKYNQLAFEELKRLNIDVSELYDEQVSKENTKAIRTVRYYHYHLYKQTNLNEKERWSINLLKMALNQSQNPVVSCSFGIDSVVTLYLTRKALIELGRNPSDIQVVWCDTLNEFPEVRLFAKQLEKEWNLKLLIQRPKKPLKKVIDEHGGVDSSYFFTRKGDRRNGEPLTEKCCETLKHEPMRRAINENNWDLQINGIRADESNARLQACLRDGEYFYSTKEWKAFSCRPIAWWTEKDIWDYVYQENIPYVSMYDKNLIQEYPDDIDEVINQYKDQLEAVNIDINQLREKQLVNVNRRQAILLKNIKGFQLFTPRVGCLMCPIPVKYGYLQFLRMYYPKVFNTMIYNLQYGKVLLEMIPEDVKEEIEFILGIDLNEENAHEYISDILKVKPCTFDKFNLNNTQI